jgi:predicted transcriptional regulator
VQASIPKVKKLVLLLTLSLMASYAAGGRKYSKRGYQQYGQADDVLGQETRASIYNIIKENSGIHFRDLCRALNKKMGVVQYHLGLLEKSSYIRSVRDGRYKHFFLQKTEAGEPIHEQQALNAQAAEIERAAPAPVVEPRTENPRIAGSALAELIRQAKTPGTKSPVPSPAAALLLGTAAGVGVGAAALAAGAPGRSATKADHVKLWELVVTSLRRKTPAALLSHLRCHAKASHYALAQVCEVSPQAITFHCQKLERYDIIESHKEGRQKYYRLTPRAQAVIEQLVAEGTLV